MYEKRTAGIQLQSLTKKQQLQLFSNKAAYIVAREKRLHVEGEVVIKPMLESFVEIFEGEVFQKIEMPLLEVPFVITL